MENATKIKVSEAYWKTEQGSKLYDAMHYDGWEGLDCLNSVIDALEEAIKETGDADIKGELEKSWKLVIQSRNAYRKAADSLRHIF